MIPQVLIVGAGPVGLTLAAELTRYGISVRIVDKNAQRTDKSKALVLWSRTLELLNRGVGADAFIDRGMKMAAANIIAGDQAIGHIDLTNVQSPYDYALMLPQSDTEGLLETHLNKLKVKVERQVEAVTFTQTANDVTTTLRHADGREEVLKTEWLIGCDGAHSMVRHTLGLEFRGETLLTDWVLADLHMTGLQYSDSELAMFWHEDGVLAVFPISQGRYRVIADLGRSTGAHPPEPTLEQIQALINRRGPSGLTISDPIWLSGFRINERKVDDYRKLRVFLAGDAAHVHSPAGGQGMNTGMQDAFNLAWKLALRCRGTCQTELLLDSYSAERSAVGDQVLTAAGRLTKLAVMKNHTAQKIRNLLGKFLLGLAPVRRFMANQFSELTIGYAHSPLNGSVVRGHSGPSPGERVPVMQGVMAVGAGNMPHFAIFAAYSDDAIALLEAYKDLLERTLRPALGNAGYVWLVRPDGYTACVAKAENLKPIEEYLNALTKTE
jgi:2-polyprenyl-6-methoxyphenol hydroxylase-like FAD-dependent oxidoreductase